VTEAPEEIDEPAEPAAALDEPEAAPDVSATPTPTAEADATGAGGSVEPAAGADEPVEAPEAVEPDEEAPTDEE